MMKQVLILDDIASLAELIKDRLEREFDGDVSIMCFTDEAGLKYHLDTYDYSESVIMVNAAYKSFPSTLRSELSGVTRFVKRALRLTWGNLNPVLAYCTIPYDVFLRLPGSGIFEGSVGHTYLDLAQDGLNIKQEVELATSIPDLVTLRTIVNEHCRAELRDVINSVIHNTLDKPHILGKEVGRQRFRDDLRALAKVLPPTFSGKSHLSELLELLEYYSQENSGKIKTTIVSLKTRLSDTSKSLEV